LTDRQKKFERKPTPVRKESLIRATLSLIASEGIDAATVRAISKHADVTQGLIRYYFTTKEDLISAAYEFHMRSLTEATSATQEAMKNSTAKQRLTEFVRAGLTPPVVDPDSVALWAGFLNRVRHDEKMRATHRRTYFDFRDRLEALIGEVLANEGRAETSKKVNQLAIACNAVVDGLWLEGGALPEAFEPGEIANIGLASISAIIGVELKKECGSC